MLSIELLTPSCLSKSPSPFAFFLLVILSFLTFTVNNYSQINLADFKPSEKVKVFYSGKELDEDKSLAFQNVRPNSVLHLVRTKVHVWPRAQKLPGENKPLRPPGAFKKKSDISVKDGHVFLME